MEDVRGSLGAQRSVRDNSRASKAEMSGEGEDVACRGTVCMKAWRNDISVEQRQFSRL